MLNLLARLFISLIAFSLRHCLPSVEYSLVVYVIPVAIHDQVDEVVDLFDIEFLAKRGHGLDWLVRVLGNAILQSIANEVLRCDPLGRIIRLIDSLELPTSKWGLIENAANPRRILSSGSPESVRSVALQAVRDVEVGPPLNREVILLARFTLSPCWIVCQVHHQHRCQRHQAYDHDRCELLYSSHAPSLQ